MLQFDEYGNLAPDQPIESDLGEVETVFVFNAHRRQLFSRLMLFLEDISTIGCDPIEAWVDGSFVTQKNQPNDIDVVLFVDYQIFELIEARLYELKKSYKKENDAYFVCVYPDTHDLHRLTRSDRIYWLNQFSDDRMGRKKGIIQIYFQQ